VLQLSALFDDALAQDRATQTVAVAAPARRRTAEAGS